MKKLFLTLLLIGILLVSCADSPPVTPNIPIPDVDHSIVAVESVDPGFDLPEPPTFQENEALPVDLDIPGGYVRVHFLDVGQGDSIFIELPDGRCMLIDGSVRGMGERIVDYIEALGYFYLDYLVITHPHSDHVGGLIWVLNVMPVGCIYMTTRFSSTNLYQTLIAMIVGTDCELRLAELGDIVCEGRGFQVEVIAPHDQGLSNMNDTSIVLHFVFGQTSIVFMGDAEAGSEALLSGNLKADLIKVGHHGSRTSSTPYLISKTAPRYAVISCGAGNPYGHPVAEVVKRWQDEGAAIYRTDLHGHIVFETDGVECRLKTQKKS